MGNKYNGYISEHLGIREDLVDNNLIIKCYGNRHVFIENYKCIVEYTDEHIRIQGRDVRIDIEGKKLCIVFYVEGDMRIDGFIKEIIYSGG